MLPVFSPILPGPPLRQLALVVRGDPDLHRRQIQESELRPNGQFGTRILRQQC